MNKLKKKVGFDFLAANRFWKTLKIIFTDSSRRSLFYYLLFVLTSATYELIVYFVGTTIPIYFTALQHRDLHQFLNTTLRLLPLLLLLASVVITVYAYF